MINRIRNFFEGLSKEAEADKPHHSFAEKEMATVALLVEAAALDGEIGQLEMEKMRSLAIDRFQLTAEEAELLIEEAAKTQANSVQLISFTRAIKEHFDEDERIELIEMLWEVAYADGVLHDYEANLLRRIGGLIYVSDRDRGLAGKRVRKRLGIKDV